jgi:hypothetical protein
MQPNRKKRCCDLRVNEDTTYISRLSIISVAAKPRTAIVRNNIVSVGMCAGNSIILPPTVGV